MRAEATLPIPVTGTDVSVVLPMIRQTVFQKTAF
jgi:hypothetical protein